MSPLFELKVELRTFNSQTKYFKRHIQHCVSPYSTLCLNVRGPAILPHVLFECREDKQHGSFTQCFNFQSLKYKMSHLNQVAIAATRIRIKVEGTLSDRGPHNFDRN